MQGYFSLTLTSYKQQMCWIVLGSKDVNEVCMDWRLQGAFKGTFEYRLTFRLSVLLSLSISN